MATLNNLIYKIDTPKSSDNLNYEEYEYCLSWFNRFGTPETFLFTDWNNINQVQSNVINIKDKNLIDSLVDTEKRNITLMAEDINRSQVKAFEDLIVSKNVVRLFRTDSLLYEQGGYERVSIEQGAIKWTQSKQRFNVFITLRLFEKPLVR